MTIAVLSDGEFDPRTSDWDGAFGKITYRDMVADLGREFPKVEFDIVDLHRDQTIAMQTPDRAGASASGEYKVAATLIRCRRLITVAPLGTSATTGVSLTFGSYLSELAERPQAGRPEQALVDLFSFRPPDYAVVGGEWALEGGDPHSPGAASVRHNVVIAGANTVAVDAVAAAVMGFEPSRIAHLELASRRGFGTIDLDSIWVRGNDISDAKRTFWRAGSK